MLMSRTHGLQRTSLFARNLRHPQVDDADVNLGLDTRSGLKPMEPRLPRTVDPLWTAAATAEVRPQAQRVVR